MFDRLGIVGRELPGAGQQGRQRAGGGFEILERTFGRLEFLEELGEGTDLPRGVGRDGGGGFRQPMKGGRNLGFTSPRGHEGDEIAHQTVGAGKVKVCGHQSVQEFRGPFRGRAGDGGEEIGLIYIPHCEAGQCLGGTRIVPFTQSERELAANAQIGVLHAGEHGAEEFWIIVLRLEIGGEHRFIAAAPEHWFAEANGVLAHARVRVAQSTYQVAAAQGAKAIKRTKSSHPRLGARRIGEQIPQRFGRNRIGAGD
jgi:hypothetical protein